MLMRSTAWNGLLAALCLTSPAWAEGGEGQNPVKDEARRVFAHAQHQCAADDGRLWGVSLCGPMLIADPATRQVIANMDGLDTSLERDGDLYVGRLPDNTPIANTATTWNGRSWTMLMTPTPKTEPDLSILIAHENWHRIQGQLGLNAEHMDADYLATEEGRLALRLELRALTAAFSAPTPEAEHQAISDALAFRDWRQAHFPDAAHAEAALERHEGLAEYTGRVLSQDPEMIAHLVGHLQRGDRVTAFARSFAYYTGPAYGVLLDRHRPNWRADQDGRRDPAQLLKTTLAPGRTDFETAGARYDIASVRAEEARRAETQRLLIAGFTARLVEGPVLAAPVRGASFSFDPNRITPLPPHGAVYGVIRAAADWGVLEVTKDGLLSSGWDRLTVTTQNARSTEDGMTGDGWSLTLAPEWRLLPGARSGDWTITRKP